MKHYLISGSYNWADEFEVYFYEIINEDDYKLYQALKKYLKTWIDSYYFGTNEGWDDDFDYLDFTPIELTEEQYHFLNSLPIGGERIFERLYEKLWEVLEDEGVIDENVNFDELPIEEKLKLIKKYADMCNE